MLFFSFFNVCFSVNCSSFICPAFVSLLDRESRVIFDKWFVKYFMVKNPTVAVSITNVFAKKSFSLRRLVTVEVGNEFLRKRIAAQLMSFVLVLDTDAVTKHQKKKKEKALFLFRHLLICSHLERIGLSFRWCEDEYHYSDGWDWSSF